MRKVGTGDSKVIAPPKEVNKTEKDTKKDSKKKDK